MSAEKPPGGSFSPEDAKALEEFSAKKPQLFEERERSESGENKAVLALAWAVQEKLHDDPALLEAFESLLDEFEMRHGGKEGAKDYELYLVLGHSSNALTTKTFDTPTGELSRALLELSKRFGIRTEKV